MAESKLAKKMKLKEGQTAAVLNAPTGYLEEMKLLFDNETSSAFALRRYKECDAKQSFV